MARIVKAEGPSVGCTCSATGQETMKGVFQPVKEEWLEGYTSFSLLLSQTVAWKWKQIAQDRNITDDSALAAFLVRHYEETRNVKQPPACITCKSALVHFCSSCFFLIPKQHQQQTLLVNQAQAAPQPGDDTVQWTSEKRAPVSAEDRAACATKGAPSQQAKSAWEDKNSQDGNDVSDSMSASGDDTDEKNSTQPVKGQDAEADMALADQTAPDADRIDSTVGADHSGQTESFSCDICARVFCDPDQLVMHMQEHSDYMLHECDVCNVRFFKSETLELHMKVHNQPKKYPCDQCKASYSRSDNLAKHKAQKHLTTSNRRKGNNNKYTSKKISEIENKIPDSADNSLEVGESRTQELDQGKFTCEQCGKGFCQKDRLQKHALTHSREKRFGCQQCGVAFCYLRSLVTHAHSHSSQKPFQCGKCHKSFNILGCMTKHVCKVAARTLQCELCGQKFRTSSQLILHSRLHPTKRKSDEIEGKSPDVEGKSPDVTASMAKIFDSTGPVPEQSDDKQLDQNQNARVFAQGSVDIKIERPRQHLLKKYLASEAEDSCSDTASTHSQTVPVTQHCEKPSSEGSVQPRERTYPHSCQVCGAQFMFQSHLTRHLQDHTGVNAFNCSQCKASCRSLARLEIHMRSHSTKNFPCHYCGKILKSGYTLNQHLMSHTGEKPFRCDDCGATFALRCSYKAHLRKHSGERPYLCPHCGKAFIRSSNLSGHIRTHTEVSKEYPCRCCGKVLRSMFTLKEHLRSHTGEKPFKCDHCGACFNLRGTYQAHLRKHTGDRPYLCSHCGKSFAHSSNLSVHLRIHTGEKPYKCTHCPMAFAIPNSLTEHLRKHTGDKPFKCSVCGKGFAKSCNRLAHFRTHNKNK